MGERKESRGRLPLRLESPAIPTPYLTLLRQSIGFLILITIMGAFASRACDLHEDSEAPIDRLPNDGG